MLAKATEDSDKKGNKAKKNKDLNRITYLLDAANTDEMEKLREENKEVKYKHRGAIKDLKEQDSSAYTSTDPN